MAEYNGEGVEGRSGSRVGWRLWRYAAASLIGWTLVVGLSLWWNIHTNSSGMMDILLNEARTTLNKDVAFRKWGTIHGGVYVPVTEQTQPNENLAHIPERDITTPTGKKLTLMNPAYMLRQMMELYSEEFGVKTRLTSLKPLRPGNAPDEWEAAALRSLESGAGEVHGISSIGDEPYLRFIRPMYTTEECLKCHARQGYKAGEVRGGLGVSVPLKSYMSVESRLRGKLAASHLAIWAVGMVGLGLAYARIKGHVDERERGAAMMERSLHEKVVLLQEVHHRVKNNLATVSSLLYLQSRSVDDEGVKRMFAECRGRIRSMALVHERLYGTQDFSRINFESYARQLTADVIDLYRPYGTVPQVEIVSGRSISLGLDVMIPIGLIINELLTNSMKHAFESVKKPLIRMELTEERPGGHMRFRYSDNGPGIPEDVNVMEPKGVGLQVINVLSMQLGGAIQYEKGGPGMIMTMDMPGRKWQADHD